MTATESAPEQEHSVKADTEYVVLMRDYIGNGDPAYLWAGEVAARDPKAAVQKLVDRMVKDGESPDAGAVFAAIAKRSFKLLRPVTETHTTITIEDAT